MNNSQKSLRLGFAGTPQFSVAALDALLRSRHRVLAVLTQPDRPAGRGQSLNVSPVKRRAIETGLEVLQPTSLKTPEAAATLGRLQLDALVVVAYGMILPEAVLALPKLGCFNIHASLLPRWRGAAPVQRALLAGDAATGVTIMRMEAGLDTGPVLAAREVRIDDRDTAGSLHDRLAPLGGELLVETLDAIAAGCAREQAQSPSGITYAAKITKAEALIDWREPAGSILRRVRAFNPWPVAETRMNGAQLRIWDAELVSGAPASAAGTAAVTPSLAAAALPGSVLAASGAGIDVACGRGVLRLLRLQLAGRKPLAVPEFLKSQRVALSSFASS
ncbi:MAG TPA: methionyl-tRNA formyltransferase [Steroidobacteraceae bacterium]|nr:methionyl-tRNA formyltransferase [Steroidobacteraceae bacterium]